MLREPLNHPLILVNEWQQGDVPKPSRILVLAALAISKSIAVLLGGKAPPPDRLLHVGQKVQYTSL